MEYVDPAVLLPDRTDDRVDVVGIGQVDADSRGLMTFAPERLGERLCLLGMTGGEDGDVPLLREATGDPEPESGTGAEDDVDRCAHVPSLESERALATEHANVTRGATEAVWRLTRDIRMSEGCLLAWTSPPDPCARARTAHRTC